MQNAQNHLSYQGNCPAKGKDSLRGCARAPSRDHEAECKKSQGNCKKNKRPVPTIIRREPQGIVANVPNWRKSPGRLNGPEPWCFGNHVKRIVSIESDGRIWAEPTAPRHLHLNLADHKRRESDCGGNQATNALVSMDADNEAIHGSGEDKHERRFGKSRHVYREEKGRDCGDGKEKRPLMAAPRPCE